MFLFPTHWWQALAYDYSKLPDYGLLGEHDGASEKFSNQVAIETPSGMGGMGRTQGWKSLKFETVEILSTPEGQWVYPSYLEFSLADG